MAVGITKECQLEGPMPLKFRKILVLQTRRGYREVVASACLDAAGAVIAGWLMAGVWPHMASTTDDGFCSPSTIQRYFYGPNGGPLPM